MHMNNNIPKLMHYINTTSYKEVYIHLQVMWCNNYGNTSIANTTRDSDDTARWGNSATRSPRHVTAPPKPVVLVKDPFLIYTDQKNLSETSLPNIPLK